MKCQSFFFNKVADLIKNETLGQVFPCEFCEIFQNTIFTEHLRTAASESFLALKIKILFLKCCLGRTNLERQSEYCSTRNSWIFNIPIFTSCFQFLQDRRLLRHRRSDGFFLTGNSY